jgi:hypothetical protein
LAGNSGRYCEFTELALDLARKISHPALQMSALYHKGVLSWHRGEHHESIRYHREAQKLARLNGRAQDEGRNLAAEALVLCSLGNFPAAHARALEGHELLIMSGYEGSDKELTLLDTQVEIHWQKAEYAVARQLTARMIQMTSRHRSPYFHTNSLSNLVQLDIITGVYDAVTLRNLAASRELAVELPFHGVTLTCDVCQAALDLRNGDGTKAYTAFQTLAGRTVTRHDSVYLSLANLGDLSNNLCGLEQTFHWATIYFAFSRKGKILGHTYQALRCLGDILLAQGDDTTAMNIFQAVLDGSTEMDVHRRRADCMSRIGDILLHRGEPEKAKDMWEAALPLFVRSSQAKDAAAIETKLDQLADRDLDAHSDISSAGISARKGADVGIAPVEELALDEDETTEIPAELLNLRAPTGQPVAKSEVGEIGVVAGEFEKVVIIA